MKTLRNLLIAILAAGLFALPAAARVEQERETTPALHLEPTELEKPAKAPGKADEHLAFFYNIYAGGVHALTAEFDLSLGAQSYGVALQAQTQGMIGSLFPWKGEYATTGITQNGEFAPLIHESRSKWKENTKITSLEYDKDGRFVESRLDKDGKETVKNDFNGALTKETVDMLTGALRLFQSGNEHNNCEGKAAVFDGKRRFNIVFKADGKDTIAPSKYSSYSGDALRCIVEVEPVAGFKKKDMHKGWMAVQEHTKARKKLPTLWLAAPFEGAPVVPVRMEISSAYGSVVAHLSKSRTLDGMANLKTGMLSR